MENLVLFPRRIDRCPKTGRQVRLRQQCSRNEKYCHLQATIIFRKYVVQLCISVKKKKDSFFCSFLHKFVWPQNHKEADWPANKNKCRPWIGCFMNASQQLRLAMHKLLVKLDISASQAAFLHYLIFRIWICKYWIIWSWYQKSINCFFSPHLLFDKWGGKSEYFYETSTNEHLWIFHNLL